MFNIFLTSRRVISREAYLRGNPALGRYPFVTPVTKELIIFDIIKPGVYDIN